MRQILVTCFAMVLIASACGSDSESALDLIEGSEGSSEVVAEENSDSAFLNLGVKKKSSGDDTSDDDNEQASTLPSTIEPASPIATELDPVTTERTSTTSRPATTPSPTTPATTSRPVTTTRPITVPPTEAPVTRPTTTLGFCDIFPFSSGCQTTTSLYVPGPSGPR